jgi:integrase/recombinase XerC
LDTATEAIAGQYCDHLRRAGCSTTSIIKIRNVLRLFASVITPTPLLAATAESIDAFLDERRLTARTRYAYVSHLHGFYEWAVIYEHLAKDPTLRVVRPRFPRSIPRPIPDDDLRLALAIAGPRERAMMALAAFHGLRACEIADLQREDILDRNDPPVLVVRHGKGGHERVLPLHPEAWPMIEVWAAGQRAGWLFVNEATGRAVRPHQVSHGVNTLLHEHGIASSLHSLRHYYGTKVYAASRDLRVTQVLLGHASPNTTVGYVAWSAGDARDAVEALHVPL